MTSARSYAAALGGIALSTMGLYSLHRSKSVKPPTQITPRAREAWITGARCGDAFNTLVAASPLALLGAGVLSRSSLLTTSGIAGTVTAAIGFALLSDEPTPT